MLIGALLLFLPSVIFLISIPMSLKLIIKLRRIYLIIGSAIVFSGSGLSLYFAAYTGDQGGVTALFLQLLVIFIYMFFSLSICIFNWFESKENTAKNKS